MCVKNLLDLLVAPDGRVIDTFLEGPLIMRNTLGAAPEPHLLAKVVSSFPASIALETGNAYFEGNAVSDGETSDLRPDGDNLARGLMAER